MSLLQRLVHGAEYRSFSGLQMPQDWLRDAFGGMRTSSGQRVTVQKAFGLAPVYAGVSYIAEMVGQLPFKVYRDLGDGDASEARDHRAWRMLHDAPNPVMPSHRFWSTVTAQLILWGNAFIQKHRTDVLVDELWLLDPARMMVEWNPATREKRFVFDQQNGQRVYYATDEILHITALSLDGLVGQSVIERCREAFAAAIARQKFEGGFYDRGAVLSGAIEMDGNLGQGAQAEEAIKKLRSSFSVIYSGADRAHQTAILEDGAKFRPMGMPLRDLEFVAAQQLTRTDIAVLLKLPPSFLGGSTGDSLTYATVEGNEIQIARHAIAPWTNTIQKAVGSDPGVFPFSSWYPEFVLEGMMRGDANARATYYQKMSAIKAMTVNEIRSRENLPPVPWGDDEPLAPLRETTTQPGIPAPAVLPALPAGTEETVAAS